MFFFFNDTATTEIYTLSLHDALPIFEGEGQIDPLDFVRTIAVARIMMPQSMVRIAAGREHMSDETQTLCFLAGANSIFTGDKLLTAKNPGDAHDSKLLGKLGIEPMPAHTCPAEK